MLNDDGARLIHQVAEDVQGIVGIRDIRLTGMLSALEKFGDGGKRLVRAEHLHLTKHEIAVYKLVERGFLTGILTVAQPLLLAADVPGDLLVAQRLALIAVDERNLHARRKMIRLDGLVCFLEIFHSFFLRFLGTENSAPFKLVPCIIPQQHPNNAKPLNSPGTMVRIQKGSMPRRADFHK